MSFTVTRNLQSGENEVKKIVDLASQSGHDIIELVWSKFRADNAKILGFEVPVDSANKSRASYGNSDEVDLDIDVKLVVGTTRFFVDDNSRCWAYVIDTPYNRQKMAQALKTGWYKVVNSKIREQIVELAKEKGLPTEPLARSNNYVKVSVKEKSLEDELAQTKKLLEQQKKKEEELEKKLAVAKGDRKPLEGVSLPKK